MSASKGQQPTDVEQTNRRKGRTYNLSSKGQYTEEEQLYLTVSIPAAMERRILQVIKDNLSYSSTDRVSNRMSSKKLTDMYTTLEAAGFGHSQITPALSAVVPRGGDVIDALDWLCLHTKDEDLPSGFSSALSQQQEESTQAPEASKPADVAADQPSSSRPATGRKETKHLAPRVRPVSKDGDAASGPDVEPPDCDPETSQEARKKYEECLKMVTDLKRQAAYAEKSEDLTKQKQLSQQIKLYVDAMHEAEALMHLTSPVSETAGSSANAAAAAASPTTGAAAAACTHGASTVAATVAASDLTSTDEGASATGSARPSSSRGKAYAKEPVMQFAYTRQTWTGKSPKQFLIDWVRKHLPTSPAPVFERISVGGDKSKCRVKIDRKSDKELDVVAPGIVCENFMEAQHLSATYALYHLCRGQQVHQLLPPPYRAVWLEWEDADKSRKAANKNNATKPRDEFVSAFIKKIKNEAVKVKPVTPTATEPDDDWATAADNIEAMFDKKASLSRAGPSGGGQWFDSNESATLLKDRLATRAYAEVLTTRQCLPMYCAKRDLLNALRRSSVVIVAGETGCGKSTQVPQLILEDCLLCAAPPRRCNILVTEPRRLAAVSLALRAAYELCDPGDPGGPASLSGYQIRFESKVSSVTCITYCTVGVALRKFQQDVMLSGYTHIILDEVHERSVESDLFLILLKDLLAKRPDLKIVLMSATMESQKMSSYYDHCPMVVVPGKTYDVKVKYIEDLLLETGFVPDDLQLSSASGHVSKGSKNRLMEQINFDDPRYPQRIQEMVSSMSWRRINVDFIVGLLRYIDTCEEYRQCRGAVLIFLPGYGVIEECHSAIAADPQLSDPRRYKVFVLHSSLNSPDQKKVFDPLPDSMRKIVLATNIAESSITIPDVVFVIDSGKVKENHYSEVHQISSMQETWVSRASADQRRGRAGRVRNGHCWRLFTAVHYNAVFSSSSRPEMQRVSLTEVSLHIMGCNLGHVADFLGRALDPPEPLAVSRAVQALRSMGACKADERTLTALGRCLRLLPVDAQLGKMLVYASLLGCLEPAAIIAAAASVSGSLFAAPFGAQADLKAALKELDLHHSDHWTAYAAYVGWLDARRSGAASERDYCGHYCLKRTSLLEVDQMQKDFVSLMKSAGLHSEQNRCATNRNPPVAVVKRVLAALTAGLYPNIALYDYRKPVDISTADDRVLRVQLQNGEALIHQNSVSRLLDRSTIMMFEEKVKQGPVVNVRHCSSVSPVSLLLFAESCCVQHLDRTVTVDKWITMKASAKTAVLFKELRTLVEQLLTRKLEEPSFSLHGNELASILSDIVSSLG